MKKEDKDLLLRDLCARLPYGVKCNISRKIDTCAKSRTIDSILDCHWLSECKADFYEIKPYLFPLSSMTEEQKKEYFDGTPLELDKYGDVSVKVDSDGNNLYTDLEIYLGVINRLLKNHFDIYGLIPMGLAIDATGLNIY